MQTAHGALQGLFLRLHPLNLPRYQTDATSHCTACDTLEGIHAPGRAQQIPDTTATSGRYTGQRRPPIIIRYIRGCSIQQTMPAAAGQFLPCADRLQVLTHCQQYRPGAPAEGPTSPPAQGQPGGVLMLPTPGGLHSGTGSAVRAGRPGTLHPAGQSSGSGHGGRRGTIGGYRRISFRAFA